MRKKYKVTKTMFTKLQFLSTVWVFSLYSSCITQLFILQQMNVSTDEYYKLHYKDIPKVVIDIDKLFVLLFVVFWCFCIAPKVLCELL